MKLRYSLLFLAFLFLISCDRKYISSIPDYPVYLELDLNFEDKDLIPIQAYKIFTEKNINQRIERVGYGGILVYHGLSNTASDAYFAFDISCPHESSRTVTVEVDESRVYAICPKCDSKFELLNGIGNRISGPTDEYLKSYQVSVNGNRITVRN
ncbi:MAG: (2Fe-2S)-binding protein [Tannerellaceae bacterium]|jgi:nitrite reductase/ring-hydroxylating ferredoxin subunit|nr:(2Fe-2S)-binding protein [Tannerellaceae bacterium]